MKKLLYPLSFLLIASLSAQNIEISALPSTTLVGTSSILPIIQGCVTQNATDNLLPFEIPITATPPFEVINDNIGIAADATPIVSSSNMSTLGDVATTLLTKLSVFNVKEYGAQANFKTIIDGTITTGTNILTSATANFTSADVGKLIAIKGAGRGGIWLSCTISSVTNSTTVVLSTTASTTVSSDSVNYATNDTPYINAAVTAALIYGGRIYIPNGIYSIVNQYVTARGATMSNAGIKLVSNITLEGESKEASIIYSWNSPYNATYSGTGPNGTGSWISNSTFNPMVGVNELTGTPVTNVTIRDLSFNGNKSNQVNYNANPYYNPSYANVSTAGTTLHTPCIQFYNGSNNLVENCNFKNSAGFAVHLFKESNSRINLCYSTNSANGEYGCNGLVSARSNICKITNCTAYNSNCDNIRIVNSDNTSVSNCTSHGTKPNSGAQANFAGIYIEQSNAPQIIGNTTYDNSSFGIDIWNGGNRAIVGGLLTNNNVYTNGNGGIQLYQNYVTISDNVISSNGQTSSGYTDNTGTVTPTHCGIHGNLNTGGIINSNWFGNPTSSIQAYGVYNIGADNTCGGNKFFNHSSAWSGGTTGSVFYANWVTTPTNTYKVANFAPSAGGSTFNVTNFSGQGGLSITPNGDNSADISVGCYYNGNTGNWISDDASGNGVMFGSYDNIYSFFTFTGVSKGSNISFTNNPLTINRSGISTYNIVSTSAVPKIVAGTGAGTSPTLSIVGNNQEHVITVTTGTSPIAGGVLFTVTMSNGYSYPVSCNPVLDPTGTNIYGVLGTLAKGTVNTTSYQYTGTLAALTTYLFTIHNGGR